MLMVRSHMTKRDDGAWHCQLCDYSSKYTTRVQDHIEAQHFQSDGYQCHICQKYCEAQGKGRAKGRLRKVTQRSFIDYRWWMVDILSLMLYIKFG